MVAATTSCKAAHGEHLKEPFSLKGLFEVQLSVQSIGECSGTELTIPLQSATVALSRTSRRSEVMVHPRRPWSSILAALAVLVAACSSLESALAASSSDFTHYYYFNEERALDLDSNRLAILDAGSSSTARVDRFLRDAGYEAPALAPRPIRGWSFFRLAEASGTPELASGADSVSSTISRLLELDRDERFFFAPVFAGDLGSIVPTRTILVQFRSDLGQAEIVKALDELGVGSLKRSPLGSMENAFEIEAGSRSGIEVLKLANLLAVQPEVVAAEPDMMFEGRSGHIPNDPNFSASWGLHNTGQLGGTPNIDVDGPESWDRNTGSPSVVTVIIDTGVDQNHADLHQLPGVDVTSDGGNGGPVNSCDNHGTPVAGIVGSVMNNGLGTAGVAPDAWIASARTFISVVDPQLDCDEGWSTLSSWTVEALDWAQAMGVRVTNNSNFYNFQSSIIASKYQETRDAGMVHFASAGNSAIPHVEWPASLPSVNAITAIASSGNRASFSSWGAEVAFTGPGDNLFTTDRTGFAGWTTGDYAPNVWGTSFSSPMIAGVAAVLLSEAYSLDADEVDALLRASALDLGAAGWDQIFGWGLPKSSEALEALDFFSDSFESGDTSQWSVSKP